MKRLFVGLTGLFLLLAPFAHPAGASGLSPNTNLTVSPTAGPRGTAIGVSAVGLDPDTVYLVQVVRGIGNVNTVRVFEETARSTARGELHYRLAMDQEPGAYTVRIVAIGGTILAMAPFTVTQDGPPGGERHFPETGHSVRGRFLGYWLTHGLDLGDEGISFREALALFGYPLSGEFEQRLENGRTYTVQYFERARMEYHPEHAGTPYEVLLGQFGRQVLTAVPGAPTAPVAPQAGSTHFPETGHNVGPRFGAYWRANGGLAQFGYPLTEPFEQRLEDGQVYTVQYFERVRLELHPEHAAPYQVELGQFGRLILGPTGGPGLPR